MISPPLPASLVAPFFEALDENEDGHIDFKELSCGMSAACRGPEMERQKCKLLCPNMSKLVTVVGSVIQGFFQSY